MCDLWAAAAHYEVVLLGIVEDNICHEIIVHHITVFEVFKVETNMG